MNHNYTIMTTGKFSEYDEPLLDRRLILFAFADNDTKRTAWFSEMADGGRSVQYEHSLGVMLGYLEAVSFGDVSLFHFYVAEVR